MDIQTVCKKIFELALVYAERTKAPVAYVNVEAGFNCVYDDNTLWETFNKLRWDTVLSSAELFIVRKPFSGSVDNSLRVVSITTFEDDSGASPELPVTDGTIISKN